MTFLQRKETETTRFYDRIANQRKDHGAALDRLESELQARREARVDRREPSEDQQHGGPRLVVPAKATVTHNPDDQRRSAA